MIQLPFPYTPGFTPPPFNWFDFTMLYIAGIEVVLLSLPDEWQREILQILFRIRRNG